MLLSIFEDIRFVSVAKEEIGDRFLIGLRLFIVITIVDAYRPHDSEYLILV